MTTATVERKQGGALALAAGDCAVLVRRSLRHFTRNGDELIQAVVLPIMLLLLFRYLLGGAINTGGPSYVNYVIAGVIVLSVAFNATATAVGMASDLKNGIVERFRSMPMFGASVLVGHVVSAVLRNVLSIVLIIGLGFVVGFRPNASAGEWLAAVGFLLLFMLAIAWISVLLGVVSSGIEAASGYAMILVFMPYASSALVPSETMPTVLRYYVDYQPFTPMIDTIRALLIGMPLDNSAWLALAWWIPILAAAAILSIGQYNRRTVR
jgi:ABC-2 type transport system permease protein